MTKMRVGDLIFKFLTRFTHNNSIINTVFTYMMILVISTSLIFGYIMVNKEYSHFYKQSEELKQDHIKKQKQEVKNEVERAIDYIQFKKSTAEETLKKSVRDRTYEAHSIAMNIYDENKSIKTKDEILKMIIDALRPIRFNDGRGYYFMDSLQGDVLLYPILPESEGTNLINLKDDQGNLVLQEEVRLVGDYGEGYITGHWKKPDQPDNKVYEKISYVKLLEPFDCYIGNGEYVNDVKYNIQNELFDRISDIRFGYHEDQYIFICSYDGVELANGVFPELVGKNLWDLEDAHGTKVIQDEIRLAQEYPEGTYIEQYWFKKDSDEKHQKLSYIKSIPEWGWVVGAGVYTDEIETVIQSNKEQMRSDVRTRIINIIMVVLVMILMASLIMKYIAYRTNKTFLAFASFFHKASTEYFELDPDMIYYSEFKEMAVLANEMVHERKCYEEKIKQLSRVDGLTGLYNHRSIYEHLDYEIGKADAHNPLSIIMLDIDYFKSINDTYGHLFGDIALKRVAQSLKDICGESNIIGRYGGEEFLVILPRKNIHQAYGIAKDIRAGIMALHFDEHDVTLTISGGVKEHTHENSTQLIEKADELLYKAKANGRNRMEK